MNCSYGQMIDALPAQPSASSVSEWVRCAHVSAQASQMIYSRHLKRATGCETSITYISDWGLDEKGRVTEPDQYYILIGHNIYWELVKIHTFDLMATNKMHFKPGLCGFYRKIHLNLVGGPTSERLIYKLRFTHYWKYKEQGNENTGLFSLFAHFEKLNFSKV